MKITIEINMRIRNTRTNENKNTINTNKTNKID